MELQNSIVRFVNIKTSVKNTEYVSFSASLPNGGGFIKCISFHKSVVDIMKTHKDEEGHKYSIAGDFQNKVVNQGLDNKTSPQIMVYGVFRRAKYDPNKYVEEVIPTSVNQQMGVTPMIEPNDDEFSWIDEIDK